MQLTLEYEREQDGRWLAEVPELPGVIAYGATAAGPWHGRRRLPYGYWQSAWSMVKIRAGSGVR
jgi:hypothetical protein